MQFLNKLELRVELSMLIVMLQRQRKLDDAFSHFDAVQDC